MLAVQGESLSLFWVNNGCIGLFWHYAIIQQFQTSMSFFTLVPSYMPSLVRMPSAAHLQPQINIPTSLMVLSTALRTSILSYQKHLLEGNRVENAQSEAKTQSRSTNSKKQKTEAKLKETDKHSHFCNNLQKDIIQQKTSSPATISAKPQPVLPSKNDAECNATKIQGVASARKSQNIKQLKQLSRQPQKDKEEVMIPEIDLNDCAYLPGLGLSQVELAALWQDLSKRRVQQWKEGDKGRRDRRELRMLNN